MDFSFLLSSIESQAACSYIRSCWDSAWEETRQEEVFLVASYFAGSLPDSLCSIRYGASVTASWQTQGKRWLWIGTKEEFAALYTQAKQENNTLLLSLLQQKQETCAWQIGKSKGSPTDTAIMGIVNVTPDSFYDGGAYNTNAIEHIEKLVDEGADVLDIGGASSRPFASLVSIEDEKKRILPVIKWCKQNVSVPISVDTYHIEVARAALEEGADMINDISLLQGGEEMASLVASFDASYCLMHIQGTPQTMQQEPTYQDVLGEVFLSLKEKLQICENAGIKQEKIFIDPGIGFGKTLEHNLFLLRFLSAFTFLKKPVLIGTSQKSMFQHILQRDIHNRSALSLASQVLAYQQKAQIFRVHNVRQVKDAITLAQIYNK